MLDQLYKIHYEHHGSQVFWKGMSELVISAMECELVDAHNLVASICKEKRIYDHLNEKAKDDLLIEIGSEEYFQYMADAINIMVLNDINRTHTGMLVFDMDPKEHVLRGHPFGAKDIWISFYLTPEN